jgi:hypothetical protein
VRVFVLAMRFSRSAADRFVRAHARPNRVDWRPLGAIPTGRHRKNVIGQGMPLLTDPSDLALILVCARRVNISRSSSAARGA